MVNDVLEQLAEDYFREKGYFTQHNVKYRPNQSKLSTAEKLLYSVNSDIDVIGIHPKKSGIEKVIVISCKSWQGGLHLKDLIKLEKAYGSNDFRNKGIKTFKELFHPEWSAALRKMVYELTGRKNFIFYLALTRYIGGKEEIKKWEKNDIISKHLKNCKIKIIDFKEMMLYIQNNIDKTPSHSELSRLVQLVKAGKGSIVY